MIAFTVNGNPVSLDEIPGEMLADLLRQRLGLTGTKIACQEDECGACTVLIDGEPVLSCSYPAAKAHGRSVTTIEGLANLPLPPGLQSEAGMGGDDLPLPSRERVGVRVDSLHPLQD